MKNDNNEIVAVVFSKNRALQCDLCLNSLYNCLGVDIRLVDIKVIYKANEKHKNSYETLKYEHYISEFIEETDFDQNVADCIKDYKFALFICDDSIFTNTFSLYKIIQELNKNDRALGVSFRLGENTTYCYSLDAIQPLPIMEQVVDDIYKYNWYPTLHDFRYVIEVSSSLYRVSDLWNMIGSYLYNGPNELESLLANYLRKFVETRPEMLCYQTSKAFAVPVNKVQSTAYLNRVGNNDKYSSDNCLAAYVGGLRIDPLKFKGVVSNAAHMEVELF